MNSLKQMNIFYDFLKVIFLRSIFDAELNPVFVTNHYRKIDSSAICFHNKERSKYIQMSLQTFYCIIITVKLIIETCEQMKVFRIFSKT